MKLKEVEEKYPVLTPQQLRTIREKEVPAGLTPHQREYEHAD